jgi:hypothetical protein
MRKENKVNDILPYASSGLPQKPSKDEADAKAFLAIIAAGIVIAAIVLVGYLAMTGGYHVDLSVVNESTAVAPIVEFDFNGRSYVFRNVAPGTTVKKRVTLRGFGQMTYTVTSQNGLKTRGIAANYFDADCEGGEAGVKVTNTGASAN